jgi:hypothetical protein
MSACIGRELVVHMTIVLVHHKCHYIKRFCELNSIQGQMSYPAIPSKGAIPYTSILSFGVSVFNIVDGPVLDLVLTNEKTPVRAPHLMVASLKTVSPPVFCAGQAYLYLTNTRYRITNLISNLWPHARHLMLQFRSYT